MNSVDRVALNRIDTRNHILVAVAGKGSSEHLEARRIRFGIIGRILRWLHLAYCDTNPRKVAVYVAQHMAEWKKEDFPAAQRIVEKLQKFQKRHPNELTETMRQICEAYNKMLAAYKAAQGLPVNEQERFVIPVKKGPDINPAAIQEKDINKTKVSLIHQYTAEQINALKPAALLAFVKKCSKDQIPLIHPAKVNGELIKNFKEADFAKELTEAQLRNLKDSDHGYFDSWQKKLTPNQIRSIQDKLNKAWIDKLDFPRQFEQLNWEVVSAAQLLEMPLMHNLPNDKFHWLTPCVNKMTKVDFKKLQSQILGEEKILAILNDQKLKEFGHLCHVIWGSVDEAIIQKLDLTQFDDLTIKYTLIKKLSPAQINTILDKLDAWALKDLPKEKLQQLDANRISKKHLGFFFPVEKLSISQLNILLPKLEASDFSSLPLSLFLQLDFSKMTAGQLSSISYEKLRMIPSVTIQLLLDKLDVYVCNRLSPKQLQEFDATRLTADQLNKKLFYRLGDFTLKQLFEVHAKVNPDSWIWCDAATLKDLLKGYESRMNPNVVKAIKQLLAGTHIPGGNNHNQHRWTPPVQEYADPASFGVATFKETDPTSAEKVCYWFIQELTAAIKAKREKNAENTNAMYKSIGAKLKEKKVPEFVDISLEPKAVWRKMLTLLHPDKNLNHPRVKELEEVFKYISSIPAENIEEKAKEPKKANRPKKSQPAAEPRPMAALGS